jgi:hypothetical protein
MILTVNITIRINRLAAYKSLYNQSIMTLLTGRQKCKFSTERLVFPHLYFISLSLSLSLSLIFFSFSGKEGGGEGPGWTVCIHIYDAIQLLYNH